MTVAEIGNAATLTQDAEETEVSVSGRRRHRRQTMIRVMMGAHPAVFAVLAGAVVMTQPRSPALLQIFREPLKPGSEAGYTTIEDKTARVCVELKCPHAHVAIAPLTGPAEVWWLNAFESEADRQRVERAYLENRTLMAALERSSRRKAAFTGAPLDVLARFRPDLSRGAPWTLRGARFVVVAMPETDTAADASVFEGADGVRYMLKPAATREQAEAAAKTMAPGARVFEVRPRWGLPAKEWIDADPEFWKPNPLASLR